MKNIFDRTIFASIVASIIVLSLGWWAACSFYIGPKLFDAYVKSNGELLVEEPDVCKDVDSRAIAVLSGLLATVIGVSKKDLS